MVSGRQEGWHPGWQHPGQWHRQLLEGELLGLIPCPKENLSPLGGLKRMPGVLSRAQGHNRRQASVERSPAALRKAISPPNPQSPKSTNSTELCFNFCSWKLRWESLRVRERPSPHFLITFTGPGPGSTGALSPHFLFP